MCRTQMPKLSWYTGPDIPTPGQAGGKVIIIFWFRLKERLTREYTGRGFGIDGDSWADDVPSKHA
jgi:1-phosphatidylinositol phosphodiesterase